MRTNTVHLRHQAEVIFFSVCFFIACLDRISAQAQTESERAFQDLAWSTDSTGPRRFISVHGRRAAVFGYSETGLEFWAYPVQIISSFSIALRREGEATAIAGQTLLRRVIYSPEAITRIYAGPDFIVRERLFVPLDEPGAIIFYEAEGTRPVDIEVRSTPVLDLMWPASIGGQEALWNSAASAFLLSELTHRFTASLGSPDVVAHDETSNDTQRVGRESGLAFTIRAARGNKTARVIIAGSQPGQSAQATAKKLLQDESALEKHAIDHYSVLLSHSLQIETPDTATNRALAWFEIALDQAWVCNRRSGLRAGRRIWAFTKSPPSAI